MNRICREVQDHLPRHVDGVLPTWRARLVDLHLRRCADCRDEHARQRALVRDLAELEASSDAAVPGPPADLLASLLEDVARPGVRGRAAVPARGAVSGARPGLSVALLVAGAVAGTAVGYAGWRGARAVGRTARRRRPGTG